MFSMRKLEHFPFNFVQPGKKVPTFKYGGLSDTSAFSGDFTKNNAQNVFSTLLLKRGRERECEFQAEKTETAAGLVSGWQYNSITKNRSRRIWGRKNVQKKRSSLANTLRAEKALHLLPRCVLSYISWQHWNSQCKCRKNIFTLEFCFPKSDRKFYRHHCHYYLVPKTTDNSILKCKRSLEVKRATDCVIILTQIYLCRRNIMPLHQDGIRLLPVSLTR